MVNFLNLSERCRQSIAALLAREDVVLDKAVVEEYVQTGAWGEWSTVDYLDQHVRERANKVAMVDEDGHRITWAQFAEMTDAFALNLIRLGFKPGDFLGVQLPNWSEFYIALMGAIKARVLIANFHLTYREHELINILGHTRARGLVVPVLSRGYHYVRLAQEVKCRLPHLVHIIAARGCSEVETIPFEAMTRAPVGLSRQCLEEIRPNGFDLMLTLITSGTTGQPKIVLHIHNTPLYDAKALSRVLGLTSEDRWLIIAPVGHSTAVMQFFISLIYPGSLMVILSAWNAGQAAELIEREKITHMLGPTPMYADLLRLTNLEKRNLTSLRLLIYGGAPMPAPLVEKVQAVFKCDVVPFYGYSEAGAHNTCVPGTSVEIVSTTVGYPIEGCFGKIVDENGKELPDGTPGEFWARGADIAVGYYNQPEHTRQLLTPDGWFKSGDLLVREKGFYKYVARADDVINRGGQKIDPKEVEDLLFTHPKVGNVVIIGMPEERLGFLACAFVVPKEKGDPLTLEELRNFLSEKGLARWKWPEKLVLKDSIPINPSGKIMRFALREEARRLASQI